MCIIFLAACSDPKNTPLPDDSAQWTSPDSRILKEAKKLPEADRDIFVHYVARYLMAEEVGKVFNPQVTPPKAKTIGEAIDLQRKYEAEQKAEADKAAALKAEEQAKLAAFESATSKTLTVAVVDFSIEPKNLNAGRFSDSANIKVAFKNTGGKDIKGVSGELVLVDMFGKSIKTVGLDYTDGVKIGQTAIWDGVLELNRFSTEDEKLHELENGKYTSKFTPKVIVFSDGSMLKL